MIRYGIQETDRPIESARSRGCSAEQVMGIIAYALARPGAWAAGGLRRRILNAFHGQPVADGWLPVSDAFQRQQRQPDATTATTLAEDQRQTALTRERLANRQDMARRRETQFGALLDAMSAEDLDTYAEHVLGAGSPAWKIYQRDGAAGGIVRWKLLLEFEKCQTIDLPST